MNGRRKRGEMQVKYIRVTDVTGAIRVVNAERITCVTKRDEKVLVSIDERMFEVKEKFEEIERELMGERK